MIVCGRNVCDWSNFALWFFCCCDHANRIGSGGVCDIVTAIVVVTAVLLLLLL